MNSSASSDLSDTGAFLGLSTVALVVVTGAGALFGVVLLGVVAAWEPLARVDVLAVRTWSDAVDGTWAHGAIARVSELGSSLLTWTVAAVTVTWLAVRRLHRLTLYVLVVAAGGWALGVGIKALVGRGRPVVEAVYETSGASFPSGHTLNATVLVGTLLMVFLPAVPRHRRTAVALGAGLVVGVVGLTRIALGAHFPTDVLGAWLLGAAWVGVVSVAFDRWVGCHGRVLPGRAAAPAAALRPAPGADRPLPAGGRTVAHLLTGGVLVWAGVYGIGLAVISWPALQAVDTTVATWFVTVRTEALTTVAVTVGRAGGTVGVLAVLAVAAAVASAATGLWRPPLFLAVAVAGETAIFLATAALVERARPAVVQLSPTLPPTSSFPSGHVAAAAALYGGMAMLVLAWTHRRALHVTAIGVAVAMPLLVALSRLYRGVHHPADVAASFLLAAGWLFICWTALRPGPTGVAMTAVRRQRAAAGR